MPLTGKGEEIKSALEKEYGKEKGERVLYAGKNKGTFTGIDSVAEALDAVADACEQLNRRVDAYCARRADAARDDANIKEGEYVVLRAGLLPLPPDGKGNERKTGAMRAKITKIFPDGRIEVKMAGAGLYGGGYQTVKRGDITDSAKSDAFAEQPAQDAVAEQPAQNDDRRVIGGVNSGTLAVWGK
jgi:hypothetical protein